MNWISSAGGPLVAIPEVSAALWRGQDPESGHYDLACSVEDVAVVQIADNTVSTLVLWDEPLATAYDAKAMLIIQWRYAESESEIMSLINSQQGMEEWYAVGIIDVFGPWILFDSAFNGMDVGPDDFIRLECPADTYDVQVAEVEGEATGVRLIRLSPRRQ